MIVDYSSRILVSENRVRCRARPGMLTRCEGARWIWPCSSDSGSAFAPAFDREVRRLTLENDREPTLRVFLKP
jgi:hypothetical protein